MLALGRELWAVGDSLLEASSRLLNPGFATLESPRALGNAAIGLRNAAADMLDGDWESVMGELEGAAVCCTYLQEDSFQGLIDLFAYEEPVPSCEWEAASTSLQKLSMDVIRVYARASKPNSPFYNEEAAAAFRSAIETLRRATKLFEAGGFYLPDDPRVFKETEWQDVSSSAISGAAPSLDESEITDFAKDLLRRVEEDLRIAATADSPALERRRVLRRLMREVHPDQNPGREEEVLPVFRYLQQVRVAEGK